MLFRSMGLPSAIAIPHTENAMTKIRASAITVDKANFFFITSPLIILAEQPNCSIHFTINIYDCKVDFTMMCRRLAQKAIKIIIGCIY